MPKVIDVAPLQAPAEMRRKPGRPPRDAARRVDPVDHFRQLCRKDVRKGRAFLMQVIGEAKARIGQRRAIWGLIEVAEDNDERQEIVALIRRFEASSANVRDAIRAIEALYEMSGLKVLQVAETDPAGRSRQEADRDAARAVALDILGEALEPGQRRN